MLHASAARVCARYTAPKANAARRLRERAPLHSCWLMYEEKRVDVGRHVRKHASALLPHNDNTRPKHRFHSVQASPLLSPTFKPLNCMSGPEFWAPSVNRAEVGASAFAVQRGSAIHAGMEVECNCGLSRGSTGGSIDDERRWVQPRETKRAPNSTAGSGVGNRPLNNTGPRAPNLLTERCGRGRVCCDLKYAREPELRSGYTVVLVGRSVFVERNDILPLVQVARNLDDGPQAAIPMAYSAEHRLVCRCWHWTLRMRPYLVPTRASAASQVRSCSIVKGEQRAVG